MSTPQETKKLVTPKSLITKPAKNSHFFGFPKEIELLCEMYKALSKSGAEQNMIKIVSRELNALDIPFNTDKHGQIYRLIPGTPLICAHMDQVGTEQLGILYVGNGMICGDANLGADDKNGCWMMLQLLKRYKEKISFLFTTNEERGGHIQSLLDKKEKEIEKMLYCLVFDRRNNTDIIGHENDYCRKDFTEVLEALSEEHDLGFKGVKGLSGDANKLRKYIATVNLSCGYHEPHQDTEWTDVEALLNALQFSNSIIRNIDKKFKKFVPKPYQAQSLPHTTQTYGYRGAAVKGAPSYSTQASIPLASRDKYAYCQAREGWVHKDAAVNKKSCKTCVLKAQKSGPEATDWTKARCKRCLDTTGNNIGHSAWVAKADAKRSCTMCKDQRVGKYEQPCITCLKTDHKYFWVIYNAKEYPKNRPTALELRNRSCAKCTNGKTPMLQEPCYTCRGNLKAICSGFTPKPNALLEAPADKMTPLNDDTPKEDATVGKFETIVKDCLTCRESEVHSSKNARSREECQVCADGEYQKGIFEKWKIAGPKFFVSSDGCLRKNNCSTCEHQMEMDTGATKTGPCIKCTMNWRETKGTKTVEWVPNKELLVHTRLTTIEMDDDDDGFPDSGVVEDLVCPVCRSTDLLSDHSGDTIWCNACYGAYSPGELETAGTREHDA